MLTPATKTGNSYGAAAASSAGASGLTTRTKKYAVKKAPNSIASEAMKRNIPSVVGSSRELLVRGRRPVVPVVAVRRGRSACALTAPTSDGQLGDDVLDRHVRVRRGAARRGRAAASPSARPGTSRRSPRRPARRGSPASRRCTGRGARSARGPRSPPRGASTSAARSRRSASGCSAASGVALRADDQEARRALGGARADAVEQRLAEHGLVGDDEDVRRPVRARDVGDDVLDRPVARELADLVEEVPLPQPARFRLRDASRRSARRSCSSASTSSTAASGPPSNTSPCAGIPAPAKLPRPCRSSRRPAAARREFS